MYLNYIDIPHEEVFFFVCVENRPWTDERAHKHSIMQAECIPEQTHTYPEHPWISQHARFLPLAQLVSSHVLFRMQSELFLIFSSASQRIFICRSIIAGEPFCKC